MRDIREPILINENMAKRSKTFRGNVLKRKVDYINECCCYMCTGGKKLKYKNNRAIRNAEMIKLIKLIIN